MKIEPKADEVSFFEACGGLVQAIGEIPVDGATVSQVLTQGGVSLWDIVAPALSIYVFPFLLRANAPRLYTQRRLAAQARDRLRDARGLGGGRPAPPGGNRPTVLCLAFEPRQADSLLPVAEILRQRGWPVGFLTSRYRLTGRNQIKFSQVEMVESYLDRQTARNIAQARRGLLGKVWRLHRHLPRSMAPGPWEGAQAAAVLAWLRRPLNLIGEFGGAVRELELARSYIKRAKPGLIMGADEFDTRARAFFLLGKSLGLPTVHVQFGKVSAKNVNWRFLCADATALFGESSRQCLVEMGLDPAHLRVTGQPRFDGLVAGGRRDGLPTSGKKRLEVLFACQPYNIGAFSSEAARVELVGEVYRAAMAAEEARFTVRPHPDEDLRVHHELLRGLETGDRIVLQAKVPVDQAIRECDMLVTFHSSTALEALIADKPVILMESGDHPFARDLLANGVGLPAKGAEGLLACIESLARDPELAARLAVRRHEFVDRHARNRDGKAGDRVAQLVEDVFHAKV